MTTYVILKQSDQPGAGYSWNEHGDPVEASSARRALSSRGVDEGTYVAVPARSWKPLTVTVEQTTRVKIT